MRRILLIASASPLRVRRKAEEILAGKVYAAPDLTILCRNNASSLRILAGIPGARLVPCGPGRSGPILREIRRSRHDVACLLWTGDRGYAQLKLAGFCCGAHLREVDIGDGHVFRLGMKNFLRFLLIRLRHPRPSDHSKYELPVEEKPQAAPPQGGPKLHDGERVLIVQSAEPVYILRALERLHSQSEFRNPRYTLFCRNRPEVVRQFNGHPMIHRVRTHDEARGSWTHWRELRREHFDGVVVFFTGDPSYWKIKYFAWLLSARHKLIINEHNDAFFFSLGNWLSLIAHRMGDRTRHGEPPRWTFHARFLARSVLKAFLFPARFVYLLIAWLCLSLAVRRRVD